MGSLSQAGGETIGWAIDTGLTYAWVPDSNFKWTLWGVTGSLGSVPKNIIGGWETLYQGAVDTGELIEKWEYKKAAGKAVSSGLSGWLQIVGNLSGAPILVNAVLAGTGLDKAAGEGMQTIKDNISTTLQWLWMDTTLADDVGSSAIDGLSLYFMKKGGEQSAKIGDVTKVSKLSSIAKQNELLKWVEKEAAKKYGSSKESIAKAVEDARPRVESIVRDVYTKPMTVSDLALHNIRSFGYDVALNSAIPLLGLAVNAVNKWEYDDLGSALGSATVANALGTIWLPKAKAYRPKGAMTKISEWDVAQTKINVTPEVKETNTPDQVIADYKPVEPIVESATKTLSDIAKEHETAIVPVATEPTVKPMGLGTTEQITLWEEWAREVPRETSPLVSQELTTTAPDIEMAGGNKPPTVYDTELGNIMNSLGIGKDVFVSKSLSTASKLGSIGGYLEKGMKKVGDQVINLRNLTQSARESAPLFANKILEIAGLDKTKIDLGRKFNLKESYVVGGITPNESTPIDKYSQVAWTIRTILPDSIKNFIGKENIEKTENLAKAEYAYMVNKWNQAKLDELFTPEEQARFAASEKLSKDVPQEMVDFLKANDLIKDKQLTDDYVRFVQSEYGRKILSEKVPIEINWVEYLFDNIESAMNSAQARRFSNDPAAERISDSMESQLADYLKKKWTNLDLLRVHSPTIQLISYAQSIGNMLQNKATIDNFRAFMKRDENKKIKDPKAFEFIAKLFPEQGQSEILNNMIHVFWREDTTSGMVKEKIADATRRSSAAILAGNLHTLIQPFYSTIPKGLMLKAAKRYSEFGHPVDTFDSNKTQTNEILSANGFVSPMEQFDTSNATKASKLLSDIAAESSGRSSEQAAKKLYVLADMAETLKRNWVTDISSKPLEIAQAWEKWARDPKNKDQYLVEQNRIHDNLGWMGESNIMNKSMFDIIRKTNLQALQGYSNSQVNKAMTDFWKLTTYIESSGDQKKAAAARTIAGILPYAATAGSVFAYLQSQNPDADPSELFQLSLSAANKMSGNVFSQAYALLSGQTSTPVTTIIPITTDLLWMIWSGIAQDGTFMQRADKLVTDVNKSVWGLTALNEVTGGWFKQMESDILGTANTEDLTRTGKAKWARIGWLKEWMERTVGLNTDTLISNYMYGKVSDAEFAKKIWVDDPSLSYILTKTASTAQWLRDGLVRPVTEFISWITWDTDKINYWTLTNINTVYGKLTPDDTTESYLAKLWVSKDLAPIVNSEIQKLFESEAGNTAGMWSANKLGGIVSDTPGYTTNSQAPLGKRLEEIRTQNPKLFNDIVASFGRLYGMNQEWTIPVDVRNIDTIKSQIFKDASMQEDAAISAVTGDNPNSTALSQSITNAYQDISKDDTTLDQKVKSLKVLDGIFSWVYNGWALAQGIERSIALESFKLLDSLKKEMKYSWLKWVQDIIAATPNILKAIKNGLTYRWFTPIQQTQWTPTAQPALVPAPTQWWLSAIASGMYGAKAPKWENVKYTPAKIEPLIKSTKSMSLSDLAKSQSPKLQKK